MPQVPKAHVRDALLAAAKSVLAEVGYERTTLATVAQRADTSIGNLYKYFAGKEELFAASIPPEVVADVRRYLRRRIEDLGTQRDVHALPETHPYWAAVEESLEYATAHRHELVFLLKHAEGTAYASFAEELTTYAAGLAAGYARAAYSGLELNAGKKRTLLLIYRAYFTSVAVILSTERQRRSLRDAMTQLASYHLAGLKAFFEAAAKSAVEAP